MIVVMKPGSTQKQIEHVVQLVREMGLKDHVIVGTERTVVAVIGDDRHKDRSRFESVEAVEKVVPILAPYKMASVEMKKERTVVNLAGAGSIGGNKIGVIAGPCSVEDRVKLLEIAYAVKEGGAIGLRGGAFKPRTSPYAFQGLAEEGLKYLAEARENRSGDRHRSDEHRADSGVRGVCGCSANRGAEHAEFQSSFQGRGNQQAGTAQAGDERDAGRVPAGG